MSKVDLLRVFVKQRLTLAAEEILDLFETTIAEYEEQLEFSSKENQRRQKLLDAVLHPEVQLHRADVQQLLVVREEVPTEQQEWSSSLDQEDPEPPHIKEEPEDLWTSQEGEQFQRLEEADIKFPFTSVHVKSEEDDEEKAQSSQLHEGQSEENREAEHLIIESDEEDCGGSGSTMISDPDSLLQPATHDDTSPSFELETDDSRDWEETKEPQSGSDPLQNNEVSVSDMKCNTGKVSASSFECARNFSHKEHLHQHTGIQTGSKPFSCSVCDKTFAISSSLISHFRVHSVGKRFSCSVCKTSFGTSSNLVRHMRIHTGEKPFSCSVCGKRFTQKEHLRVHLFAHTGEKPFGCSVCSKRFSFDSNLRQHMAVHTGEKPLSCSFCSKRFTLQGNLRKHLIVHTGEKPFACSICDKRFTRLHNVKKHKCVGESSKTK
ncbi:uncharacterized protein LOC141753858 [Sebastes fasciatus]|uniref:uncharacterized protein LOC141753858 n=1 Tax=Sebastes fasciatus TaxID=394691 RepID=UPI003D9EA9BE